MSGLRNGNSFYRLVSGGGGLHLYDEKCRHRKFRFKRGGADFAFGAFIGGLQRARQKDDANLQLA